MSTVLRRILFIWVVIVAGVPAVQAAEQAAVSPAGRTYTLGDLYRLALTNAESVAIKERDLFIAEKNKNRAFSALVPRLKAFGNYMKYSEDSVVQPSAAHAYGAKLEQQFTLNGRELTAYQIAKDQIDQARFGLKSTKERYLLKVAAAYYDVLRFAEFGKIALANVKRLETHKAAVEVKLNLQELPQTELYRTVAELSKAKTDLVKAENGLKLNKAILASWTGLSGDYDLVMPQETAAESMPHDLSVLKNKALQERADLQVAKIQDNVARSTIDYEKGEYWPTLGLEAGYQIQGADPSYFAPDDDSLWAAANLEFVLYDWGLRSATVSQAKARKQQSELAVSALGKQIRIEVEQAYFELVTADSTLRSLRDQLTAARELYQATELRFRLGSTDSLDVIDANTKLATSELELSEAEFNRSLALLKLEQAQGIFLKTIEEKYLSADNSETRP